MDVINVSLALQQAGTEENVINCAHGGSGVCVCDPGDVRACVKPVTGKEMSRLGGVFRNFRRWHIARCARSGPPPLLFFFLSGFTHLFFFFFRCCTRLVHKLCSTQLLFVGCRVILGSISLHTYVCTFCGGERMMNPIALKRGFGGVAPDAHEQFHFSSSTRFTTSANNVR